jgi:hypothetical protein
VVGESRSENAISNRSDFSETPLRKKPSRSTRKPFLKILHQHAHATGRKKNTRHLSPSGGREGDNLDGGVANFSN